MKQIPIEYTAFREPVTLTLEASFDTILDQGLYENHGDQFDYIAGVLSIDTNPGEVIINTCWTMAGIKVGQGRGTYRIPREALEAIYVPCKAEVIR